MPPARAITASSATALEFRHDRHAAVRIMPALCTEHQASDQCVNSQCVNSKSGQCGNFLRCRENGMKVLRDYTSGSGGVMKTFSVLLVLGFASTALAQTAAPPEVTFHKDVEPILEK